MTPEDFNPDYLVPGTRIGAYIVRGLLGQGGSSSVYEVESAEGHRFALKLCRYHGGAPYRTSEWRVDQRYSRSIACLQLLKGRRNVAELYGHDRYPDPLHGHQYLVQELVPGGLLITDWVKQESPTLRKLIGAFVELAELCGVMASKGICHRDLKPPNILVTPDGTPKVIDFESATCPYATPVTRGEASEVPGTGGWQSPELCQAILEESKKRRKKKSKQAFDFLPWGDLFSLGVVFYECLTGEHPFDTSLPEDMLLEEVAFVTPIHPMRLSTAVPLGLNKVVMKLLKKQPKARYREGAEVAKDLRRLLEKVKDKRWDKPFKQPVPDEEEAPVLSLVPALVPPQTPTPEPVSVKEQESEGPMPDTPHSQPHSMGTGAPANNETSREATSSPQSAKPDAADTDVLLSDELETAEPRGLQESAILNEEGDSDIYRVLNLGKAGVYTLEERLGRGGMGEVYKARQAGAKGFSQLVAIKRLRPGQREWAERSFADEARVLSLLHHENIARVYGFFELEGDPYLVMEYIEGHSLYALLELARRKGRRFSESVACAVMAEVADALDYAHHVTDDAGQPLHIVHRDVSPTNILIAKSGRVVLLDFGVALFKQEGRIATPTGSTFIKGKAPYLSPEQVKHLPLDARSDLFSVGTILVEMLTGEAPFGCTADFKTLKCITSVTPEYVASLLPGVSEPLRALCQQLLALSPDQRLATGREVAMALRHHAGLGEGPQSIQAEVERFQALPNAKPSPAVAEVAARALSGVKHARRAVALAGAFILAILVLASWYVPRHYVPVPSSPPVEGPAISLSRPAEKTAATSAPPPNGTLMGKPKRTGGAAVATPRHNVVATPPSDPRPTERSALTVVLANKKSRGPPIATAPLAGGRTDEAARVSVSDEDAYRDLRSALAETLKRERALREENERLKADDRSADQSLAALLMNGDMRKVGFRRVSWERLKDGGLDVKVELFSAPRKAATLITLTNGRGNPSWKFGEARVSRNLTSLTAVPFSFTTDRDEIGPGETGKIVVVVDGKAFASAQGLEDLAVQIFRDDGIEELLVNLDRALVQR